MYAGVPVVAKRLPVFEECFANYPYYFEDDLGMIDAVERIWATWDYPPDSLPGRALRLAVADARLFVTKRYSVRQQGQRVGAWLGVQFPQWGIAASSGAVKAHSGKLRVAMITTWGNRCGIAETTREVVSQMPCSCKVFAPREAPGRLMYRDTSLVERCWDREFRSTGELTSAVLDYHPDVMHVQHEFSLYRNEQAFLEFLNKIKRSGIRIAITLHTFMQVRLLDRLQHVADALVTTKPQPDSTLLRLVTIPLPVRAVDVPTREAARNALGLPEDAFIFGTHGFWNPHKGFKEFMGTYPEVLARCPGEDVRYIVSGFVPSKLGCYAEARAHCAIWINQGKILLYEGWAEYAEVLNRLAACDVLVFNYNVGSHSSASAAIRDGMTARRPILCTDCAMFSELRDGVDVLKAPFDPTGAALWPAMLQLKQDGHLRKRLADGAQRYALEHTPQKIAEMHARLYERLCAAEVT
jgi:glycosyltransferase involved in cell wall biosynthesis